MARPEYRSYRPHNAAEKQRELTPGGRLNREFWKQSAAALAKFLEREYSDQEIKNAVADAVYHKRFNESASRGQRTQLELYFTICKIMKRDRIAELPWSDKEYTQLLRQWEQEPILRNITPDVAGLVHKLARNGAFDHFDGLSQSIVAVSYLPGVNRLMSGPPPPPRRNNSLPFETGSGDSSRDQSRGPGFNALRQDAPKGPRNAAAPQSQPARKMPEPIITTGDAVLNAPVTATPATPAATEPPTPITAIRPGEGSLEMLTSHALVQEGLNAFGKANMMPTKPRLQLLSDVISMLERACFYWAIKSMPMILKQKEWTDPSEVPLIDWLDLFQGPQSPLKSSTIADDIAPALREMHHDWVRRTKLSVGAVVTMMQNAQKLADILQDEGCMAVLFEITARLSSIDSHSSESRERLKSTVEAKTVEIVKKYKQMAEDEIREMNAAAASELDTAMGSCEWDFKFDPPSDDYYAGKETLGRSTFRQSAHRRNASCSNAEAGPSTMPAVTVGYAFTSSRTAPAPRFYRMAVSGIQDELPVEDEAIAIAAFDWQGQELPEPGTQDFELYHLQSKMHHGKEMQISLVKQALALDKDRWEALRTEVTRIIEREDLLDLLNKDVKAKAIKAQKAFKAEHADLFKNIHLASFADLLCELTFHSARRGIKERKGRKDKQRARGIDDEYIPDSSPGPGPYRQGSNEDLRSRLAKLPQSGHAANRGPPLESPRSTRPTAAEMNDAAEASGTRKRSLPAEQSQAEAAKRVKTESSSQEQGAPTTSRSAVPIANMRWDFRPGQSTRMSSMESGEIHETPRPSQDHGFASNSDYMPLS